MKVSKPAALCKIMKINKNSAGDKKRKKLYSIGFKIETPFKLWRELRNRFQLNGKAISWKLEVGNVWNSMPKILHIEVWRWIQNSFVLFSVTSSTCVEMSRGKNGLWWIFEGVFGWESIGNPRRRIGNLL